MKWSCIVCITLISGALSLEPAAAQETTARTPPTTAAAEVTGCAQAQMVVDSLLSNANARIEAARQNNNPVEMRATVDALQTTIRDVRAQLAACANPAASDPHPPHTVPGMTNPLGVTDMPVMKTTEPATGRPAAAPAKPSASDPHAGHTTPPAKPAPKTAKPSTGKPAGKPAPAGKPPAADPHAGHTAAATSAPAQSVADGKAVDPVCGLRVDPADAATTKHGGRTYHFCSVQHRDLFVSNPAKYLRNKQ